MADRKGEMRRKSKVQTRTLEEEEETVLRASSLVHTAAWQGYIFWPHPADVGKLCEVKLPLQVMQSKRDRAGTERQCFYAMVLCWEDCDGKGTDRNAKQGASRSGHLEPYAFRTERQGACWVREIEAFGFVLCK